MTDVAAIQEYLTHLAPPDLAESWDNVGLLTKITRSAGYSPA